MLQEARVAERWEQGMADAEQSKLAAEAYIYGYPLVYALQDQFTVTPWQCGPVHSPGRGRRRPQARSARPRGAIRRGNRRLATADHGRAELRLANRVAPASPQDLDEQHPRAQHRDNEAQQDPGSQPVEPAAGTNQQ